MRQADHRHSNRLSALECGRVSAIAGQAQRDLLACAGRYPGLFPADPFDPAFFSTIALAHAFCAPWLDADQLRLTNRISLWAFALDRAIDELATDRSEVDDIGRRCGSVAGGASPPDGDSLCAFLAEIRDDLAVAPAFPRLREEWVGELARALAAMAQEWEWKEGPRPTLQAYLDNAETGFSLVFVTHWISTIGGGPVRDASTLLAAGRAVQQFTSLVNDIGSYRRDLRKGDINALLLCADRAEIDERLATMAADCRRQLLPLLGGPHRPLALFLDRHLEFNAGFYRVTDYQGGP